MAKLIGAMEVKAKYQVTISSSIRKKMKVKVGDVIAVLDCDDYDDAVLLKKIVDEDILAIKKASYER